MHKSVRIGTAEISTKVTRVTFYVHPVVVFVCVFILYQPYHIAR